MVRTAEIHSECRVLTLQGVAPDGAAFSSHIIQPFDDVQAVRNNRAPKFVGQRRWQRACRDVLAEDGGADSLLAAAGASIELLPFQLEPAIALLKGLGTRVLIADDVGLGKTIQAMVVVTELRARGLATRVLILCPAGLRDQWAEECVQRFALPFAITDQSSLRRAAAQLPHGVNPWTTHPLSIVSVDYVKRPEVLSAALSVPWDLVIIDEAHGSSGTSGRQEAVTQLATRAQYVVLLTATPHNGDPAAFTTLCDIGSHGDGLLVFRRSKREVGHASDRRIHLNRIALTDDEQRMHAELATLTDTIRRERVTSDSVAWLVLSVLHKRALSGGHALAASVARRLSLLRGSSDDAESSTQLGLPFTSEDDDAADAPPMWSDPALRDVALERALLERLLEAARVAARVDSKLRFLRRFLTRLREPAIVFTEYRDTLLYLRDRLDIDAAVIHGGLSRAERQAALAHFRGVRVLLATDAAGEGLNLHERCRTVINLELPWNPMRLEQRIGRVDRIGQQQRVHVIHLVSESTGETELLRRLVSRVKRAQRRIATANPLGEASWTEIDSARLVLRDGDSEPTRVPRQIPLEDPGTETEAGDNRQELQPELHGLRLIVDSEREARRVLFVRQLRSRSAVPREQWHDSSASRPPVVRSVRSKLRRMLAAGSPRAVSEDASNANDARWLAIYRVTMTDAHGRRVATRIVGLTAHDASRAPLRRPHVEDALRRVIERFTGDWVHETTQLHALTCSAYVARATSIVRALQAQPRIWQPGLFDRRANIGREQDEAERSRLIDDVRERLLRATGATRSVSHTCELVLLAGGCDSVHRGRVSGPSLS